MANQRYVELRFQGKTFTQTYQINEILLDNKLGWFIDCEVENIRCEIMKDTLIINGGIFYNGVFEYGVIRDLDCRNMTFQNGVIYNGVFKRIKVEKGIILDGTFIKGDILFADIRGGDFKDVNISNNVNKTQKETQTTLQQPEPVQPQGEPTKPVQSGQTQAVQVQGEVQGQEGQNIQSQVQESRIIKKFESYVSFASGKNKNDEPNIKTVEYKKGRKNVLFSATKSEYNSDVDIEKLNFIKDCVKKYGEIIQKTRILKTKPYIHVMWAEDGNSYSIHGSKHVSYVILGIVNDSESFYTKRIDISNISDIYDDNYKKSYERELTLSDIEPIYDYLIKKYSLKENIDNNDSDLDYSKIEHLGIIESIIELYDICHELRWFNEEDEDYPSEPIGGDNPYLQCKYCHQTEVNISIGQGKHPKNCKWIKYKNKYDLLYIQLNDYEKENLSDIVDELEN